MKATTKLLLLFIIGFCLVNCSSDDDTSNNSPTKILQKADYFRNGSLFYKLTTTYNSDQKIQSVIVDKYNGPLYIQSRFVKYSGNTVSEIRDVFDYDDSDFNDRDITYNVEIQENTILLTSENRVIEITHTNGYANSLIEYMIGDPSAVIRRSDLTRDENQNLISHEWSHGNIWGNGNIIDYYSDFDSNKEVDQLSIVIDFDSSLMQIFNLKVTANNPHRKIHTPQGQAGNITDYTYEYDNLGYIVKTNGPVNSGDHLDIFYIE